TISSKKTDIGAGYLLVPCQCAPETHSKSLARVNATYARRRASDSSWILTCSLSVKTSRPWVSASFSPMDSDQPSTPERPAHSRTSEAANCSHFGRVSRSPRSDQGKSPRALLVHKSCCVPGKMLWFIPGTKTASH